MQGCLVFKVRLKELKLDQRYRKILIRAHAVVGGA
jgi:hypothetical protein